jgi:predicted  nucleic acid-binding Zn-ribbon protein
MCVSHTPQALILDKSEAQKQICALEERIEHEREAHAQLMNENLHLRIKITKEFKALGESKQRVISELAEKLNQNIQSHQAVVTQLQAQVAYLLLQLYFFVLLLFHYIRQSMELVLFLRCSFANPTLLNQN